MGSGSYEGASLRSALRGVLLCGERISGLATPPRGLFPLKPSPYEPGSPGRVFLLDENELAARLFDLEEASSGLYRWSEAAGLKQLIRERDVSNEEALGLHRSGLRVAKQEGRRMMALADRIHVARRYQRAIRIDTDIWEPGGISKGLFVRHLLPRFLRPWRAMWPKAAKEHSPGRGPMAVASRA